MDSYELRCKCENLSHLSHDGVEVAVPQPPLLLQAVKQALKVAHLWQIVEELAGDSGHKCSFHKLGTYHQSAPLVVRLKVQNDPVAHKSHIYLEQGVLEVQAAAEERGVDVPHWQESLGAIGYRDWIWEIYWTAGVVLPTYFFFYQERETLKKKNVFLTTFCGKVFHPCPLIHVGGYIIIL